MKRGLVAFLAGVVFSAGLCLSGMTQPSKILAFLDVTGQRWDPSLAFVMIGALGVAAIAFQVSARRGLPLTGGASHAPPSGGIDAGLLVGAAIFGVGWGLSGLCPGPAVVSLASGQIGALVFVGSMLIGMAAHRAVGRLGSHAPDPGV